MLVHPRHTGPRFTSISHVLKRRHRRCRAGCASLDIEKGVVEMEMVCSSCLPQLPLADGLVGFECRHMMASRWTPREGPNSCPTIIVVVNCFGVIFLIFLCYFNLFFVVFYFFGFYFI